MLIKYHFIISVIFAGMLFPFFGKIVFLIILIGTLMDIDHIPPYILRFKKFNFKESYEYYRCTNEGDDMVAIFHSIELIIAIFLMWLFFNQVYLLIIFLSIMQHAASDFIADNILKGKKREFSLIMWLARCRINKN